MKEVRDLLQEAWLQSRLQNPSYSLRAFARSLKIAPSALSEILNGKRRMSLKMALIVVDRLRLDPEERAQFIAAVQSEKKSRTASSGNQQIVLPTQLSVDRYRLVADWFHFAILSLAETEDFDGTSSFVAKKLRLPRSVANAALERMERLGMLEYDQSPGRYRSTGLAFSSPDGVAETSLRNAHLQNLELAKSSLERDNIDERDFGAMTMAIDPALLPEAKKKIRQFRRELSSFLESGKKKRVYKICMQLFPLSINDEDISEES